GLILGGGRLRRRLGSRIGSRGLIGRGRWTARLRAALCAGHRNRGGTRDFGGSLGRSRILTQNVAHHEARRPQQQDHKERAQELFVSNDDFEFASLAISHELSNSSIELWALQTVPKSGSRGPAQTWGLPHIMQFLPVFRPYPRTVLMH